MRDPYASCCATFQLTGGDSAGYSVYMAETDHPPHKYTHMNTICLYTFNTLTQPGHADIELMLEDVYKIWSTDRIAVHAQTINVTAATDKELTRFTMLDTEVTGGANIFRTIVP